MKILKKNQLTIFVISLMLITAGYLNYTSNNEKMNNSISTSSGLIEQDIAGIGDATLVSSNGLTDNEIGNLLTVDTNTANESSGNISSVNSNIDVQNVNQKDEYFATSKLERDKMYSQIIESYQTMLENESITSEQRAIATEEISKINNIKNVIMISENLIKMKGFKDCIIFVNGESISVIIRADELKKEEIAQIQNIISREMQADITNIHISNK